MAQAMRMTRTSGLTSSRKADVATPLRVKLSAPKPFCSTSSSAPSTSLRSALAAQQRSNSLVTRVAAAESAAATQATQTKEFYALVASSEFYFNDVQNESLAEQLRERVRFFKEQNREIDFWIVPEPTWLDAKYPDKAKQVKRPCTALISTDKVWITFMKLRLDRVLRIDLGAVSQEEALKVGGKVPEFTTKAKWTAPYGAYSKGWWEVFVPKQ